MGTGEDRISYLPESILVSILTMMPLKSAIQTDVLSKKWRNLWKQCLSTATTLEFSKDFANNLSAKEFVETVNRYLLLNDSKKLEKFHVLYSYDLFASDIESWISFATVKRVRYLDIDLSQGFRNPKGVSSQFELPSSLFDCDSLIDLSLSRCNFITPLNLINFGGLQSLSVSDSNINEKMLQSILTECSLLESLNLRSCQKLVYIRIMVPNLKLKRLTIRDCWLVYLQINAPKLQSFYCFGGYGFKTKFLNMSSLEDAAIYTYLKRWNYPNLLSDLSHVQILTLSSGALMHLNQDEENLDYGLPIELQNLQELQLLLDSMNKKDLTFFYKFFSICSFPFLEKLFIQLRKHNNYPDKLKYGVRARLDLQGLDNLTYDHLKVIKVTNFNGSRSDMRLVSFLLQKATVLETMVLVIPHVKERLILKNLRAEMLLLREASPIAQINLLEFGEDDGGLSPMHLKICNDLKKRY